MVEPSIYDQLAKESLSALTVTQLNAGSSVTAIDQATINYWKGPITLARIVESSRTYCHGMPIPEASIAESQAVDPANYVDISPTGSQEFQIVAISVTAAAGTDTAQVYLTDGSTSVLMHAGATSTAESSFFPFEAPFTITKSLYLRLMNTSGANAMTFKVAYNKVSL